MCVVDKTGSGEINSDLMRDERYTQDKASIHSEHGQNRIARNAIVAKQTFIIGYIQAASYNTSKVPVTVIQPLTEDDDLLPAVPADHRAAEVDARVRMRPMIFKIITIPDVHCGLRNAVKGAPQVAVLTKNRNGRETFDLQ